MDATETIASLEHQLADFYAGRERLDHELGVSDPEDILALVNDLRHRRGEGVALDKNGHNVCLLAIATLYNLLQPDGQRAVPSGGLGLSPQASSAQAAALPSMPVPSVPAGASVAPRSAASPSPSPAPSVPEATPPPVATAPPVKDINEDRSDSFIGDELLSRLHEMSQADRDSQDFGIVEVNASGIIQSYNRYESELAGVEPNAAVGRNFFTQVAPCTNNRLFYGRFKRGVAAGQLDAQIPYTFTYKMRPTNVIVRMYHDAEHGSHFVLVKKR